MKYTISKSRALFMIAALLMALMLAAFFYLPVSAQTVDNGLPDGYEPDEFNGIPAQQFKDVFETETVTISGIEVRSENGYVSIFSEDDTIHFRIFNSTTQETEYEVDTVNNKDGTHTLPDLELKKFHNYIFFVEDPHYMLGTKKYVQILPAGAPMATEGAGAYDYKHIVKQYDPDTGKMEDVYNKEYEKLRSISVYKRDSVNNTPRDEARCCIGCTDLPVVVTYKGNPVTEKLSFRFVSDVETRPGMTNYKDDVAERGILYANLLEDITYMVYLNDDRYYMDPFPIVVKDKSEYREGRYAYDHTTCVRVDAEYPVRLYDNAKEAENDPDVSEAVTSVTSLKGRVKVSGMNFRHLLILDRVLDKSLAPGMDGKDFEVIGITAVNPHRWEISKLLGTDFDITWKCAGGKLVTHVYYIKNDTLKEISFKQTSDDDVNFTMDSLSLYPVVIEYSEDKTYADKVAEDKAAADAVKDIIDDLPASGSVTTADKAEIEAARAAYEALTDDQKDLLDAGTVKKLTDTEKALSDAQKKAAAEAKAKKVKTVTVNVATVNAKAIDKAVKSKGGSAKYVTEFILGSKVKKISPKAFDRYKKVTVVEVRTKKLTKKSVKNSLSESKVKTIKVNVAKKVKTNKTYVKKYKKIFTKKIAGRKVTVKR